jgi:hypothetical protein
VNESIYEIQVLRVGWDRPMPICECTSAAIAVDVVRSLLAVRDPDITSILIVVRRAL